MNNEPGDIKSSTLLDAEEILLCLKLLNNELEQMRVKGEISLYGGTF